MDKDENVRLPRTVTASKPSSNDRLPTRPGGRERSGIYLESTEDEHLPKTNNGESFHTNALASKTP